MTSSQNKMTTFLESFLSSLIEIPDDQIHALGALSELRTYAKGEHFLRVGENSDRFAIVRSGLFRAYYLTHDGKSLIRKFYRSKDLMGAFATALAQQPAHVTIDTIDDAETIEFRYRDFTVLRDRHPVWEKISRILLEKNYVQREARAYQLMAFDAAERYRLFKSDYQDVYDRISKGDIASYLGISPVSLSRIIHQKT